MNVFKKPAIAVATVGLSLGAFAGLSAGNTAFADDVPPYEVTSGHVDIVEIECSVGDNDQPEFEVVSHLDANAYGDDEVEPGDIGDYEFTFTEGVPVGAPEVVYNSGSSRFEANVASAFSTTNPFVGFAFDELEDGEDETECEAAFGNSLDDVTITLASVGSNSALNQNGYLAFDPTPAGYGNLVDGDATGLSLHRGDHVHGGWLVGAVTDDDVSYPVTFNVSYPGEGVIGTVSTTIKVVS